MTSVLLLITSLNAGERDSLLGVSIGQDTASLDQKRTPQGAFMSYADVGGERGVLLLVPCGLKVHEIVFQVTVFAPWTVSDPAALSPSIRMALAPRDEARRLRAVFEGALGSAGWLTVERTDHGPIGHTDMVRRGLRRSVFLECGPEDPAAPGGAETCKIAIHAGGDSVCTDGL